jgi:exopolysaccharide production protein ExoY
MNPPANAVPDMLKRSFDFLVALTALLVLSPILLVAALIIKVGSPGPVFYRGVRVGLRGLPFRI